MNSRIRPPALLESVREVKKQGGNATVQVSNNYSFAGIIYAAPGVYMAVGVKRMQFAVCSLQFAVCSLQSSSMTSNRNGATHY